MGVVGLCILPIPESTRTPTGPGVTRLDLGPGPSPETPPPPGAVEVAELGFECGLESTVGLPGIGLREIWCLLESCHPLPICSLICPVSRLLHSTR